MLKLRQTFTNEVISDMCGTVIRSIQFSSFFCEFQAFTGHFNFREVAFFCNLFYYMAIMVTGIEIHRYICFGRVIVQNLFNMAHGFNKFTPVESTQETKAANAVADRNLICSLLLVPILN